MPYQLGGNGGDTPERGMVSTHTLNPGDTIVLGTDGLFDNLFSRDIEVFLKAYESRSLTEISKVLAEKAQHIALTAKDSDTPFSIHARSSGVDYKGGKLDDITVIVVKIQ